MKLREWLFGRTHPDTDDFGPTDAERRRAQASEIQVRKLGEQVARHVCEVQPLVARLTRATQENHLAERVRKAFQ